MPDRPQRIAADNLGQVVVAVLEILRDLLERQAIRRAESGDLAPDDVERLGQALIALDRQFAELRAALDVERTLSP